MLISRLYFEVGDIPPNQTASTLMNLLAMYCLRATSTLMNLLATCIALVNLININIKIKYFHCNINVKAL